MSNVDLVRALFDDFNRGDFDAALAKLDPEVEWGAPPDVVDTPERYLGHAEVVTYFTRFMGAWSAMGVEVENGVEVGDRVVAVTRWSGRSRGTGIEVDQRVAQVYEFRDGKVLRLRQFRTREEALEAASA